MKTTSEIPFILFFCAAMIFIVSCSKSGDSIPLTVFSVSDDIGLGYQMDQEILDNPLEYPLLDSIQYVAAYAHLDQIRNAVLASGKLTYTNDFAWKFRIIRNDSVVNAFCTPGGYIYIYTGIIKALNNEAQFAGVLAHEMAHADCRHTSEQLTLVYGETLLLSLILGNNPSELAELVSAIALGLGNLAYSPSHEYEADSYAVKYLYPTQYDAASLGDFFTIMQEESPKPIFLSAHPSPEDRLTKINEAFASLGGVHGQLYFDTYQQFKKLIP